ncbi:hypothetical protein ACFV23_18160 [Streptomyces sp. NPDC059627]
MVAAVCSDPKSPIPAIDTSNHGLATAVSPSARVGALAPDQVAGAYEDLYETGGKNTGTRLASTAATRAALSTYRERTTYKNAKYATLHWETARPTRPRIYALRLRDGGAVVVFPTAHNRMEQLEDGYIYKGYIKLVPGSQQASSTRPRAWRSWTNSRARPSPPSRPPAIRRCSVSSTGWWTPDEGAVLQEAEERSPRPGAGSRPADPGGRGVGERA